MANKEASQRLQDLFKKDRDDNIRMDWKKASVDGRAFMHNDLTPLEEDGLVDIGDKDKPVVKMTSLPEKINFLFGRIFFNQIDPRVSPYEGEELDETSRMVADALFRYEKSAVRSPFEYNLMEEIEQVVKDALIDGFGVSDHRGDDTLRTELLYKGQPVHRRIDPHNIIFDRRADRNKHIRHAHIIDHYTEEEFKEMYPRIVLDDIPKDYIDTDPETQEEIFSTIETQELVIDKIKKRVLDESVQKELFLTKTLMEEKALKEHIKNLKEASPSDFAYIDDIDLFVNEFPKVEVTDWGMYSTTWTGGVPKVLIPKEHIGSRFTFERLGFFPIAGKPYWFGVPHYLRSPIALEVIGQTIFTRLVMRADNPGGFFREGSVSPDELNEMKLNKIGNWIGIQNFDQSLKDTILQRDVSQILQYMELFLAHNSNKMNDMFGTWREQMGRAAFAGQSGRSTQLLVASGAYMFLHFVKAIDAYLPRVFRRVLDLAIQYIPPETLAIIAGEGNPEKMKAVLNGKFAERMRRVNVDVNLDTTTESEQGLMKNIVAQLLVKGGMAPASGFRELKFKEPSRMAQEMEAHLAKTNRANYWAQLAEQNPALAESFDTLVKEYESYTKKPN